MFCVTCYNCPVILEGYMTSLGATRQQLYRKRKKRGLRCIQLEVRSTEVQELVRRGYLKREEAGTAAAIRAALYKHLDRTLTTSKATFW